MDQNLHSSEGNMRDILYILFRHIKKTTILFLSIFVLVTVWTFVLPEYYMSEAKLLIKMGRESVALDPTATTGQTIQVSQPREFEINSELEILKSREVAEKIVRAIGVEKVLNYPDEEILSDTSFVGQTRDIVRTGRKGIRSFFNAPLKLLKDLDLVDELKEFDDAVLEIENNLQITVQSTSNIIIVSFEARTPKLSFDVITNLINFYLEKHINVYRTSGSYEFFTAQTDTIESQLNAISDELRRLKNTSGIASIDEQKTMHLERISLLKLQKDNTDVNLAVAEKKVIELEKLESSLPSTVEMSRVSGINNSAYGFMKQALYNLQLKEQELLSKYTESNKFVVEIRRQITEAETVLNTENPTHTQITQGINAAYQQVLMDLNTEKANRASLHAQSLAVNQQLKLVQDELVILNDNESEIIKLKRTQQIQENNYSEYAKNLEQARIDQALQLQKISNISIVQTASYPMNTSRPNKLQNIFLGLLFAIFISIGGAFIAEYMDNTIKSPEDVMNKIKLETLVVIAKYPKIKS